jgi:mannitol operon repressor
MKDTEPEFQQLARFMNEFNKESDRGAALVAASMLDEQLQKILSNFLVEGSESKELLVGFNAPLGSFSARVSAAFALGLIQENEFREINLIRKIRNEFGHGWEPVSFESGRVADFSRQLPWLGPSELEKESSLRERFNFAVAILLTDLLWRARLVTKERRVLKEWPYKIRSK